MIGGHVAQFSIGLTDTVMLGWYGVAELAAVTLGSTYFFSIFLLGSGFAFAVMPMVAAAAGSGEERQIRRTTRMGLWLSLIYGALAVPLLWWSEPILLFLGQNQEVAHGAADRGTVGHRPTGVGVRVEESLVAPRKFILSC